LILISIQSLCQISFKEEEGISRHSEVDSVT
jgi:hypothetical protein